MAKERLLPKHCKAITSDNDNDVTPTNPVYRGHYPVFFNAASSGTINIVDADGYVCNGVTVNAGWNAQPFRRLLSGGTVTAGIAGWTL